MLSQPVYPGSAWVAQTEKLGDFVVGFTGGIVYGAANEGVVPGAVGRPREIEMCVSTGDDESESGLFVEVRTVGFGGDVALVEESGVDVALKMVDGDEWDVLCVGEGLCVGNADEERSGKARTRGDSDGVKVVERDAGLGDGSADDWNDGAKMLAGRKFRNDSAIAGVGGDLRGNDRRESSGAALDDGKLRRSRRRKTRWLG